VFLHLIINANALARVCSFAVLQAACLYTGDSEAAPAEEYRFGYPFQSLGQYKVASANIGLSRMSTAECYDVSSVSTGNFL
jgi:hypothetical protein